MTSVWLVSRGSYSDYRIVAAFSTKELAEGYAAKFPNDFDGHEVEEYELDQPQLVNAPRSWRVMTRPQSVEIVSTELVEPNTGGDYDNRDRNRVRTWGGAGYYVIVDADDEAHARKIAADLFREFVALPPRA